MKLSDAWHIDRRIQRKIEERDRLQALLEAGRQTHLTGMPRGGNHDWTDTADKVIALTEQIDRDIAELVRVKTWADQTISRVRNVRYRNVLELRYKNYMTFEQIAEEMNISLRWVYILHKRALRIIGQKPAQKNNVDKQMSMFDSSL